MISKIKQSQNFLKSSELVRHLLSLTNISSNDIAYEIGSGRGVITSELLKVCKKIIAFEIDSQLIKELKTKFSDVSNFELIANDFLKANLPNYPYKVFSNIPFNQTADIIKKLLLNNNSPTESYLIVQKEAIEKFMKNSQISAILFPQFTFEILYHFKPTDFSPVPRIKIVLVKIEKKHESLVNKKQIDFYRDFVTYCFNHKGFLKSKTRPSQISLKEWPNLFQNFLKLPLPMQKDVYGEYQKQLKLQSKLEKINRTRVDKNWKQYSKIPDVRS